MEDGYHKEYYQSNKDKWALTEAQKESKKEYMRLYRIRNRAKLQAQQKVANDLRKESSREYNKSRHESKTLPYNVIYCIPNYDGKGGNYAGVTNNVYSRMSSHRYLGKQNTEDFFILDIKTDRKEALASELRFHKQGYHGIINKINN